MEKYRAIPRGYMTVGELAKRMGVTVRTLQYYDRMGLLHPSGESEGGRRLYTEEDADTLDQILALKSLGFSLKEILCHMTVANTPEEIARLLHAQAEQIREQVASLSRTLDELEAFREEVVRMQRVDFKRYTAIIHHLQMPSEQYRIIKYLDDELLEYARTRFSRESGAALLKKHSRLNEEAIRLAERGVSPTGEEGQRFAAEFWNMIEVFIGDKREMLPTLMKIGIAADSEKKLTPDEEAGNAFIGRCLEHYLKGIGIDSNRLLEEIK